MSSVLPNAFSVHFFCLRLALVAYLCLCVSCSSWWNWHAWLCEGFFLSYR